MNNIEVKNVETRFMHDNLLYFLYYAYDSIIILYCTIYNTRFWYKLSRKNSWKNHSFSFSVFHMSPKQEALRRFEGVSVNI